MAELTSLPDTVNPSQMLFGINQGRSLRISGSKNADEISMLHLDGYAVGGLAVGETHEEMYHILDVTVPHLPQDKPTFISWESELRKIFSRVSAAGD